MMSDMNVTGDVFSGFACSVFKIILGHFMLLLAKRQWGDYRKGGEKQVGNDVNYQFTVNVLSH